MEAAHEAEDGGKRLETTMRVGRIPLSRLERLSRDHEEEPVQKGSVGVLGISGPREMSI